MDKKRTFFSQPKKLKIVINKNSLNIFRSKISKYCCVTTSQTADFTVIISLHVPSSSQNKHRFMSSLVKNLVAVSSEAHLVLIGLDCVEVSSSEYRLSSVCLLF